MRILGIDQAVGITGISIIDDYKLVGSGTITPKKKSGGARLSFIVKNIRDFIHKYKPDKIVREGYSMGSSGGSRAVFTLGEIGGCIIMMLFEEGYTEDNNNLMILPPKTWKKFVLGSGNFDKYSKNECGGEQLEYLEFIKCKFGLELKSFDAADAVMMSLMALKYFKIKEDYKLLSSCSNYEIEAIVDNKKFDKFKEKSRMKTKDIYKDIDILKELLI